MPHNSFNDINNTASYMALIAGVWGAILNFIKRDNNKHSISRKILMFILDMLINIGITMLIYIGAVGYGLNDLLSVAIAGFLGHQGTRSFYLLELIISEKLGASKTFNTIRDSNEK